MLCCSECFSSVYLKEIINSNQDIGVCDFCGAREVSIYNPRELALIFQRVLELYKIDEKNGDKIEKQIVADFFGKIFSEKIGSNIRRLLEEIMADGFSEYKDLFTKNIILKHFGESYNEERVKPLEISWERFASEIKSTNRFFIQNALDLEILSDLLANYEKNYKRGKIFYRARVSENVEGYKIGDMKNPPQKNAKAGRANPQGISYLYIANDVKTTLYEARVALFDYVTVGDFRLKESIKVVNLRGNTYDPFVLAEKNRLEHFLVHLPFIAKLERELSKPRRRSDNELDYLPTQYLSEFIKSMGYDGIEFQSSLYPLGYNLAIFNPNKFECIKVTVYEIENIDLSHKTVS